MDAEGGLRQGFCKSLILFTIIIRRYGYSAGRCYETVSSINGRVDMRKIREQLATGVNLVSDGAWGTFLQAHGLKPGECPELWCLEHRAEVLAIPRSYIAAGADMVESNSFGANLFKLELYGLAHGADEIIRAAAAISREAAGPDRLK